MALGKVIASEITSTDERNFTGKWIAHFLAERLKVATKDEKVRAECVDLILKLWRSRKCFPNGDPLSKYEPLLAALRGRVLSEPKHVVDLWFEASSKPRKGARKQGDGWLDLAAEIDRTSSLLISFALRQAADEAGLAKDRLLNLASEVDQDTQTELLIEIRTFLDEKRGREGADREVDPVENGLARLEEAISKFRTARTASSKTS